MADHSTQQNLQIAARHHRAGQLRQAETLYRQILEREPNNAEALHLLGLLAHQVGRNDEALDLLCRAIAIRPDFPQAHHNLGIALRAKWRLDEAIAAYRRAIELKPNWPEAYFNLGNALKQNGQLDESIAAFGEAVALKPDFRQASNNLGVGLRVAGRIDDAIAAYRHAISFNPDYITAHDGLIYTLYFHPAYDARSIAEELGRWNRQHAEPMRKFIRPDTNDPSLDGRLRIGYVSPDFGAHPVGRFLRPLLAHHDKSQFEVFAYAQVPMPDPMTHHLKSFIDHWRDIVKLTDTQTADLIRHDRIDILVDLTMHAAHNRLLVFAQKPAPVQVTYLAYPGSTGLSTIDYRLSDPYLDPVGTDESVYSERTIRLPETFWCYEASADAADVGPLPASAQGFITFGSLNNFCKVNQGVLEVWGQVLRAVPNSQLLIHAHEGSHRQQFQDRLKREGISAERIRFAGKVPLPDYFRLYHQIDVALDTFPYAGGTTTCDALWMGVPVVSLIGQTAVGRSGLSLLSNIGLPELAAGSKEEYLHIASELAGELPRLADLRSTLRQRMERSPLMDAPRFARNVEAAYRQMWQSAAGGLVALAHD